MAAIKLPIKIDGFKCVEDMAQAVLNYTYKGKTLKEWADSISEPQTRADRIRGMSDEELAELWWERVDCGECPVHRDCRMTGQDCKTLALDWLKQEASNGQTP